MGSLVHFDSDNNNYKAWIDGILSTLGLSDIDIVTTTATGTQNDLALGSSAGVVILQCNNASALNITGIAGGVDKRILFIVNKGSSTVRVLDDNAGSSAANRINTPSTNGQIIGSGGVMLLIYSGTDSKWFEYLLNQGAPVIVAYNAGNFTSDVGSWTVDSADVVNFSFIQQDTRLTVTIVLNGTTTAGSPTALKVALPNGFTAAALSTTTLGRVFDNTIERLGLVFNPVSATVIHVNSINMNTGATVAFSNGSAVSVQFEISLTVI